MPSVNKEKRILVITNIIGGLDKQANALETIFAYYKHFINACML